MLYIYLFQPFHSNKILFHTLILYRLALDDVRALNCLLMHICIFLFSDAIFDYCTVSSEEKCSLHIIHYAGMHSLSLRIVRALTHSHAQYPHKNCRNIASLLIFYCISGNDLINILLDVSKSFSSQFIFPFPLLISVPAKLRVTVMRHIWLYYHMLLSYQISCIF